MRKQDSVVVGCEAVTTDKRVSDVSEKRSVSGMYLHVGKEQDPRRLKSAARL
jgi:hypothetical protein